MQMPTENILRAPESYHLNVKLELVGYGRNILGSKSKPLWGFKPQWPTTADDQHASSCHLDGYYFSSGRIYL